jgi:oligo-1,6-glucosidase
MTCRLPIDHRDAVVYQIYPRSFCDSNGDGIGDLPGITSRLDHLQALGVNVVWLSPIFASPQDDNGYDISDYRAIAPEFGTMADFDDMLAAMHARGIRLMMDLVVNHSSDEHAWFEQARSSRDNPFHDYYIWREPRADATADPVAGPPQGGVSPRTRQGPGQRPAPAAKRGGHTPPTNWEAAFNGSVWEWNEATGDYYLHMFSRKQPDLNWENPRVRSEVHDIMRFWLDRGVDGFRMDVINMISRPWNPDGSLPDAPVVRQGFLQPGFALSCNGPRLHEFLAEMRREVLDHYPGCITVGEAPLATVKEGRELTHPDSGALNMLFQFEHMDLDSLGGHVNGKWALKPLQLPELKRCLQRWQDALDGQGWNSLYWSNHDQPRPVSRFGCDRPEHRVASAKLLAMWLHGMQGTPYIYQGDELGMCNVAFERIEDYQDIETRNHWRTAVIERGEDPAEVMRGIHAKGRDNARTPMPWRADAPHAGFSSATPWLALNPQWREINAAHARQDPHSVFHHHRHLVALRRAHPILARGSTRLLWPDHPQLVVLQRQWENQTWLIVCNRGCSPCAWPGEQDSHSDWRTPETGWELLLGNLPERAGTWVNPPEAAPSAPITLKNATLAPWEAWILR